MTLREAQQAERIRELVVENEDLRDRLRTLQEALGETAPEDEIPGLTASERCVLGALLRQGVRTKQALYDALYALRPPGDDPAEIKVIDVFVCKIRRKLKEIGSPISIETVWGVGYRVIRSEPTKPRL